MQQQQEQLDKAHTQLKKKQDEAVKLWKHMQSCSGNKQLARLKSAQTELNVEIHKLIQTIAQMKRNIAHQIKLRESEHKQQMFSTSVSQCNTYERTQHRTDSSMQNKKDKLAKDKQKKGVTNQIRQRESQGNEASFLREKTQSQKKKDNFIKEDKTHGITNQNQQSELHGKKQQQSTLHMKLTDLQQKKKIQQTQLDLALSKLRKE